ncbi:hypothetical protein OPV22_033951 [Ensete ventricosum]|uniref:Secreted protein n=1 Tax=Ensete ventricosum TaxID=4639 RepID=A0AAV8Q1H4_ENSVE|nr:hypothetical protein OPV22_033951 [Ensete ventricosum]
MGSSALPCLFRLRVRPSALSLFASSLFHCTAQVNPIAPNKRNNRTLRVVERTELELEASSGVHRHVNTGIAFMPSGARPLRWTT